MKGMRGKILKKLKSIPQVTHLKHGQINPFNNFPPPPPPPPPTNRQVLRDVSNPILEPINKEEDKDEEDHRPMKKFNNRQASQENKENMMCNESSFRRPDPNSATLFDPKLLLAFQEAVKEHSKKLKEISAILKEEERAKEKDPTIDKSIPKGAESIVLYTTSLRGIRQTFEDCSRVRMLLENMRLVFVERDMSMHIEYREELWRVLGFRAIPPRLFIRGRYIGGADEVVRLHEQGKLMPLVEGIARKSEGRDECGVCGGMRFKVCGECNGGRKLYVEGEERRVECRGCNENGLVVCSFCC